MPLGLWLVESGELHISRVSARGKSVVLDVLEPGDLVGLAAAVSDSPYETAADTASHCRLHLLPRIDLLTFLHGDVATAAGIAVLLAAEVAAAQRWIGNTTLAKSVSSRVAAFLLDATPAGLAATTHSHLALRIGATREQVSRILAGFRQSGALSKERGCLALRDRGLLERIAS